MVLVVFESKWTERSLSTVFDLEQRCSADLLSVEWLDRRTSLGVHTLQMANSPTYNEDGRIGTLLLKRWDLGGL